MTLRNTDVVDWVGLEKGTGDICLTLLDEEDWSSTVEHVELLQEKLNRYLAFIESGEVYEHFERHPSELARAVSRTTPVKVHIVAQYPLPPAALEFLEYAQGMFATAGFALSHEVRG